MSTNGRYDTPADGGQYSVKDDTSPDAETSNAAHSANDLWQAFAASAGNAALRVVLTLAFALLVIVVLGQVSGTPAEAASMAVSASSPPVDASSAQAASDDATTLASLPLSPIALSHPPQAADLASLRRGAAMFSTYCLACHAAGRVRFGQLRALGFSDAEIAATLNPSGAPLSGAMHAAMPAASAEKAFGRVPPDLSLAVREKGSAWLYTYLRSFYVDPNARMGANNVLVPDVAMPNVLAGLQGEQNAIFVRATQNASNTAEQTRKFVRFEAVAPGSMSAPAYDRAVAELVAYMAWMADPQSVERRRLGPWVVGFLVLFSFCGWGLMRSYWRQQP